MAYADYRLCDVCSGKVFYDAHLNYDFDNRMANGDPALDHLGDWAVVCSACAKTHKCTVSPTLEPLEVLDWSRDGMIDGTEFVRLDDVRGAIEPAYKVNSVAFALKTIHDTFADDIKNGSVTRDKKFAVEIAALGLRGAYTATAPLEVRVETVRHVLHPDVRRVLEAMLTYRGRLIDGDTLADHAANILKVIP